MTLKKLTTSQSLCSCNFRYILTINSTLLRLLAVILKLITLTRTLAETAK